MYRFLTYERLQLFFATPNMFAAFLVLWLGVLLTVIVSVKSNKVRWLLFSVLLLGQFVLAFTYSRGGFIAWTCCLLVFFKLSCKKLIVSIITSFYFFILCILPGGELRIFSIVNVEDRSIVHRFFLWLGGLGIIRDFPFGCKYPLGDFYELQYMPYFINENYHNFLSDSLTLGCKYGVFAIWVYWFIIFIFFNWLYSIYEKNKCPIAISLLAILIGTVVSGLFSTFYFIKEMFYSYIFLYVIIIVFILRQIIGLNWKPVKENYILPFLFSLILIVILLLGGEFVNSRLRYRVKYNSKDFQITFVPKQPIKKVIYFCSDKYLNFENGFYPDLRRWASNGVNIKLIKAEDGLEGLNKIKQQITEKLEKSNDKHIIIGVGTVASNVLIAVAQSSFQVKIQKLLLYNCEARIPFENLSAIKYVDKLNIPVVLLVDNAESKYQSQLIVEKWKCEKELKSISRFSADRDNVSDIIFNFI